MKKILKVAVKFLLGILILLILFLLGVFFYNRIMLLKEKTLIRNQQISQLVEVDGHNMSIYEAGEGEHSLVFMAGSGAPTPIIDYKSFATRFESSRHHRTLCALPSFLFGT